jgi:hypothetical protein
MSIENLQYKSEWTVRKFKSDDDYKNDNPYEVSTTIGNLIVTDGANFVWQAVCGTGGLQSFNSSNSYLGVGNSISSAQNTDTDLLGTMKLYKAMEPGFPTFGTLRKATWKSVFGALDANFPWEEFCVTNYSHLAGSGILLNRKVTTKGTKTEGETWELTLTITFI